jgi:hypothetical protein
MNPRMNFLFTVYVLKREKKYYELFFKNEIAMFFANRSFCHAVIRRLVNVSIH